MCRGSTIQNSLRLIGCLCIISVLLERPACLNQIDFSSQSPSHQFVRTSNLTIAPFITKELYRIFKVFFYLFVNFSRGRWGHCRICHIVVWRKHQRHVSPKLTEDEIGIGPKEISLTCNHFDYILAAGARLVICNDLIGIDNNLEEAIPSASDGTVSVSHAAAVDFSTGGIGGRQIHVICTGRNLVVSSIAKTCSPWCIQSAICTCKCSLKAILSLKVRIEYFAF